MRVASQLKRIAGQTYHKSKHLSQIILFHSKRFLRRVRRVFYRMRQDKLRDNHYGETVNRVLIFNIFEGQERLQPYKLIFLEKLCELVSECHIVVNGELHSEDEKILSQYGHVTIRENRGYDVAAFRYGIKQIGKEKLSQFDQLLIVNDTNVGPFSSLEDMFKEMDSTTLDFWGISLGEEQPDFTMMNPLGYIPTHIQTFFLVIEHSLLTSGVFYDYWDKIGDTDSRDKAIGRHETYFTSYFHNLGYRFDTVVNDYSDSAIYIHPLRSLKQGAPIVKYTALGNYDEEQFLWQDLVRDSEVPELLEYIKNDTDYPYEVVEAIVNDFKEKSADRYILIVDGVENIIPQCTRYRVENKAEQLRQMGYPVKVVNRSELNLKIAKNASSMIIYRAADDAFLDKVIAIGHECGLKIYYDIDDLVFDTKYTDQLAYTQGLSVIEKENYDEGVRSYGRILKKCDGVITSTTHLAKELTAYTDHVHLMRNVLSQELVEISQKTPHQDRQDGKVRVAYFSGSITHNENFELIKPAIINILKNHPQVELHLVGHLDIPKEMKPFSSQLVTHPYVDWKELPELISSIDINLAPLVISTFNIAKSEIKWLEAAAVKVPTVASQIGAFEEMMEQGVTGVLAKDDEWETALEKLILDNQYRQTLADNAYAFVMANATTSTEVERFLV